MDRSANILYTSIVYSDYIKANYFALPTWKVAEPQLENVRWRQECATKVGLGFKLPESPLLDKFCEFWTSF